MYHTLHIYIYIYIHTYIHVDCLSLSLSLHIYIYREREIHTHIGGWKKGVGTVWTLVHTTVRTKREFKNVSVSASRFRGVEDVVSTALDSEITLLYNDEVSRTAQLSVEKTAT